MVSLLPAAITGSSNPDLSSSSEDFEKKNELLTAATDVVEEENAIFFECDYEKNCTELYKTMETGDWTNVVNFLDTGYWLMQLFKASVPPKEQVRTWVTRKAVDEEGNEKILWSQLPLHLAIVMGAPWGVLRRMLELYPASIRCTDDLQMLPLHLALRKKAADEVVERLLQAFPEAVITKCKSHEQTALLYALNCSTKVRCMILTTFVKFNSAGKRDIDPEVWLKIEDFLTKNKKELKELHKHLITLETMKNKLEEESNSKVDELSKTKTKIEARNEQIQEAKMSVELTTSLRPDGGEIDREIGDLEINRVHFLIASKKDLVNFEKHLMIDEAFLLNDIEAIEVCIARCFDIEDLEEKVKEIRGRRLRHARERLVAEKELVKQWLRQPTNALEGSEEKLRDLDSQDLQISNSEELLKIKTKLTLLKNELKGDLETSKVKTDLKMLQRLLEHDVTQISKVLEKKYDVTSNAELMELKPKLDQLKTELSEQVQVSRVKTELQILRTLLEHQLQQLVGLGHADLDGLGEVIESMQESKISHATLEELEAIRDKAREIKRTVQYKEALLQTKEELQSLKSLLSQRLMSSSSGSRAKFQEMLTALDAVTVPGIEESRREAGLVSARLEMASIEEELKRLDAVYELKHQIGILYADLNDKISKAWGIKVKKDDLSIMRAIVEDMSKSVVGIKTALDANIQTKEVESFNLSSLKPKDVEDAKSKLKEMSANLTKRLRDSKSVAVAMMEELKRDVDDALGYAEGDVKEDLRNMKHTLSLINLDKVEGGATEDEWTSLKTELQSLKVVCRRKELKALRQKLERELRDEEVPKRSELVGAISTAVGMLDYTYIDKAGFFELECLKKDVEAQMDHCKEIREKGEEQLDSIKSIKATESTKSKDKNNSLKKMIKFMRKKKSKKSFVGNDDDSTIKSLQSRQSFKKVEVNTISPPCRNNPLIFCEASSQSEPDTECDEESIEIPAESEILSEAEAETPKAVELQGTTKEKYDFFGLKFSFS